jgi:hypothetical protein
MSTRKPDAEREPFVTASHHVLFEDAAKNADAGAERCDACGVALRPTDLLGDDEGFAIAGRGVYISTRGDEVRYEDAPLCPACASAIGMSALARWEIEEEEG